MAINRRNSTNKDSGEKRKRKSGSSSNDDIVSVLMKKSKYVLPKSQKRTLETIIADALQTNTNVSGGSHKFRTLMMELYNSGTLHLFESFNL